MDVDFRGLQERLRQRVLAEIHAGRLTGLQLAREAGFRQAHISNFLNSKRGLSLEAMDAVLKARGWKLAELLPEPAPARQKRRSLQANSPGVSWIPLVDAKKAHAREVPYDAAKNALRVMTAMLERACPAGYNARASWVRFVAVRVSAEDAHAMSPKLTRGAMVVVDRYAYEPKGRPAVYAVRRKTPPAGEDGALADRITETIAIRYVERAGREWVMRAENPAVPLAVLEDSAEIVGRVRIVISEV